MTPVHVTQGPSPVILGMPHTGTYVPPAMIDRLNDEGRKLRDTDWHVDRLYDGLLPEATVVRATFHRYVIDANRDPSGESLYPGRNTTGLVPLTDFDGRPIWQPGAEPTQDDIEARLHDFHAPYHAALAAEIERVRALHGVALLYDCHSIRPVVPYLFDGRLPDFNVGTNDGATCAPAVEVTVRDLCAAAPGYTSVVNGRFKGGWTTRHYGHPGKGVHAIQMELAQSTHLDDADQVFDYAAGKAATLRPVLGAILKALHDLAPALAR